ncbi:hypothetical protein LguiA_019826 [Lonicera macranthoides]
MFGPDLIGDSVGLSDVLEADAKQIATVARETFEKDGPLLVVASGRDTIPVASSIKRLAPKNVFVVQIQHPRSQLDRFDLVIAPRHDYYPLSPQAQQQIPWFLRRWITPREPPDRHVVLTVGALHQADSIALQNAAFAWHNELAPLEKPLLVVNVGGPTRYGVKLPSPVRGAVGLGLVGMLFQRTQFVVRRGGPRIRQQRQHWDLWLEKNTSSINIAAPLDLHIGGATQVQRPPPPLLPLIQPPVLSNNEKPLFGFSPHRKAPFLEVRYGVDLAKQLTTSLKNVLPSCGSLRISFSRRTPRKVSDIIVGELGNHPKVYIWDGEDPNPHMGHLAWADAFLITADSVSMLSEACSTGKPVYVIGAERCTWKFADFQKSLQERGAVRPFTGNENISEKWEYPPLNDTAEAAGQVIEALAIRGWGLLQRH